MMEYTCYIDMLFVEDCIAPETKARHCCEALAGLSNHVDGLI